MINFIVFNGIPEYVYNIYKKLDNLEKEITFISQKTVKKISANKKWGYIAWCNTEIELRNRIADSSGGICLVNGPVIGIDGEEFDINKLLTYSQSYTPEQIIEKITGCYNYISITTKNKLLAFSDFSCIYNLFYTCVDGVVLISNRGTLLANLTGNNSYNLSAFAWMISSCNLFSDITVYKNIYKLPMNSFLYSELGSSQFSVKPFSDQIFPYPYEECLEDLNESEWDNIVDLLLENFRLSILRCGEFPSLSLTGGKDSRVMVALGSVIDKDNLHTFTFGPKDSPEIECAAMVASMLKIKHTAKIHKNLVSKQDFLNTWTQLFFHAWRFEGSICPWDGCRTRITGIKNEITGFAGECWRGPGGHAKQFKNLKKLDKSSIQENFYNYQQTFDPLGVLRNEFRLEEYNYFCTWLSSNISSIRFDLLPEKFFIENRLANWNGPMAQNVTGNVKYYVFLSRKIAKLYYRLSPLKRSYELLHFHVIRKICPELISIPFLNDTWNINLDGYKGMNISKKPFVPQDKSVKTQSWQSDFIDNNCREIIDFLRNAKSKTDIDCIFDVEKVFQFLKNNKPMNVVQYKTILSCILVAIMLQHKQLPVYDTVTR